MLYPELVTAVNIETARDDLVDETAQAIIASTQKMHGMDFFRKDIVPGLITFNTPQFLQYIDLSQIPQYRKVKAIRKWDPTFADYEQNPTNDLPPLFSTFFGVLNPEIALAFLKIVEADDIFDPEYRSAERLDIAYEAGTAMYIKSSTQLSQAIILYYQWPNLDISDNGANFSSWVAALYPYSIVYDAASSILQKIGMTDAARKYDYVDPQGRNSGLVQNQVDILLKTETPLRGY